MTGANGGNRRSTKGAATQAPSPPVQNSNHSQAFDSWSYETGHPLFAGIYPYKGVVHSNKSPGHRSVLQATGKRVDVTTDRDWEGKPFTRVVAIGASGSLSSHEMTETFDQCLAPSLPEKCANS